ncbi:hypothetical protein BH09BAC3_BH09BAC3_29110 [soil metagenome]
MKISALFLLMFVSLPMFSQTKSPFIKMSFAKDITFVRMDSVHGSQSTVIEYPKFLAVIELPFIDTGANRATDLQEDVAKADSFLNFLQAEYKKPVKFIFSSHWHLHSLSGITPFFKKGAKLVVAETNWAYSLKNGLLSNSDAQTFATQVIPIHNDTTLLKDTQNPIDILFLDKSYAFKPTQDYLFFYLPKSKTLHASCMCAMGNIDFKQRTEFIYSDRVSDLDKAIEVRKISVDHLIKLTAEYDTENRVYRAPTFTREYFSEYKRRGKPMHTVVKTFTDYDLTFLINGKDSIIHQLLSQKISPQIINSATYACIKQKEYKKAVEWARILNLYQVGELNFIDTMGEAYLMAGDVRMATYYSQWLTQKDPKNFPDAIKTWEANRLSVQD